MLSWLVASLDTDRDSDKNPEDINGAAPKPKSEHPKPVSRLYMIVSIASFNIASVVVFHMKYLK